MKVMKLKRNSVNNLKKAKKIKWYYKHHQLVGEKMTEKFRILYLEVTVEFTEIVSVRRVFYIVVYFIVMG